MAPFSHFLTYPCRFFHPRESSPRRTSRHQGSKIHPRPVEARGRPGSLPLETDLSAMTNPSALPEHLVEAVLRLRSFLPIGCELLGQDDLKTVGTHPIDAGGFADVWIGERNDGTTIAIKSHRYHSSSSCLPVYLVSDQRYPVVVQFVC